MKIAVTGATGFVGKLVCSMLVKRGHDLVVFSRDSKKAKAKLPLPAQFIDWDPNNQVAPSDVLDQCDAVIHLAGETVAGSRWSEKRKQDIWNSRSLGTKNLVDGILKTSKPLALISASAIGFYGQRHDQELNETSMKGIGFLSDVCEEWEKQAGRASENKTRVAIFRIGVVLGLGGGALEKLLLPFRMGAGGPIGDGKQWMSWIHLNDLARLFVEAAENSKYQGLYNATAPNPVSNAEFGKQLGRALGRPAFMPTPALALKMVFGEMSEIILASQKVFPTRTLSEGFQFEFSTIDKAFDDIVNPRGVRGAEVLETEQFVPKTPEQIFPFFSDEKNLETLTPPWLNFKVLGKDKAQLGENSLINYKLKIKGVPVQWQSRIESWKTNEQFVDTQVKGPYALWHHTHSFIPVKGGTLMTDKVVFKAPMGLLGAVAAMPLIKKDIDTIFSYRRKKIAELFGGN